MARSKRPLRHPQQLFDALINHADRHRRRGVPDPAILDDADIELHDVAVLNPPLTADSVHDFVV